MKAVLFRQHGGPEVLEYTDFPTPEPKPGEALIRLRAAALNRMDVLVRNGWIDRPFIDARTEGWEDGGGIRRDFPSETQRIVTESNGSSWKQHHYFSEEREIWSKFVISDEGAHMAMQRNRAKFGPVTNDSTIDFSPPMLVGLADPEVGRSWSGKWRGKTSGSFAARIVDHRRMQIGRESIEVWGYELRLELRGELDGSVFARVMYSPEHALTVQEHYTQDIQSERGRYRAEWRMTLQSTTPQR